MISWDAAVAKIRSGEIVSVFQSHSRGVTMRTKEGIGYAAEEPEIDLVWRLVEEIDPEGKRIHLLIE